MYFLLVLFWIILNGKITTEIFVLGLLIAAAVYAFACRFMDFCWEKEKNFWKHLWWVFCYIAILIKEIAVANLAVLKIILTPGKKVHPVLVSFEAPLKSELLKVVLADSITLTPGTITVRLNEKGYVVHCLDESMAAGLNDSVFVKQLKKWEDA